MPKIFADHTSLFSKVLAINKSVTELNTDLKKISQWAYKWKMQFNPDPNKQENDFIFSCKLVWNNLSHLPVKFNNNNITRCSHQKHSGVLLDSNLNFNTLVDQKTKKCNKMIGLLRQLSVYLSHNALLTIYKFLIRSHLDYGDFLYDKPSNDNFQNTLAIVEYRSCLVINGEIQRSSRERLYDELGLYSSVKRRRHNTLVFFY